MADTISYLGSYSIPHCITAEDLLPQRKHTGSWDEDKAYSTPGKYYPTLLELCTYFFRVK